MSRREGVDERLSSVRETTQAPALDDSSSEKSPPRRGSRVAYALALVWIAVGSALYAVEVTKLLSGIG